MIESAGILAYKILHGKIYVLLAHPGGPYCEKKEYGCWSIPKGAVEEGETRKQAARREFREETGFMAKGKLKRLGSLKTNKRKNVTVFATKMDVDTSKHRSNTFILEWPAKSGNYNEYPETDKCEWFDLKEARDRICYGQINFLDRLQYNIAYSKIN